MKSWRCNLSDKILQLPHGDIECKSDGEERFVTYQNAKLPTIKSALERIPKLEKDLLTAAEVINFFCHGLTYEVLNEPQAKIDANEFIFHVQEATSEKKYVVKCSWPFVGDDETVSYRIEKHF